MLQATGDSSSPMMWLYASCTGFYSELSPPRSFDFYVSLSQEWGFWTASRKAESIFLKSGSMKPLASLITCLLLAVISLTWEQCLSSSGFWCQRSLHELFERASGIRLHMRVGNTYRGTSLSAGIISDSFRWFQQLNIDFDVSSAIISHEIIRSRLLKLHVMSLSEILYSSVLGPLLRAAGSSSDIRSECAWYAYSALRVPYASSSDVFSRLLVRSSELFSSVELSLLGVWLGNSDFTSCSRNWSWRDWSLPFQFRYKLTDNSERKQSIRDS